MKVWLSKHALRDGRVMQVDVGAVVLGIDAPRGVACNPAVGGGIKVFGTYAGSHGRVTECVLQPSKR